MSNTPNPKNNSEDELLPEYDFDYRQAYPNRFALSSEEKGVTVTLQPDVAEVFKTSEEVNQALRAILSAIPSHKSQSKSKP